MSNFLTRFIIIILCGLFGFIHTAMAEILESDNLKHCHINDKLSIAEAFERDQKITDRKLNLYIRPFDIASAYQQDKLLVIDTRSKRDYEKVRIPKSLNLAPEIIKHKSFLKKKPILLINDGKSYAQLEKTASELMRKGFSSVKILDGGIKAWSKHIQQVDGQTGILSQLVYMEAKEFLSEKQHGPWLIVDVGDTRSFSQKINGEVVHLKLDETFIINLRSILRDEVNPLVRVLFVSNDKLFAQNLEAKLTQITIKPYHILKQTTPYLDEVRKQALMAHQKTTQNKNACGYN